MAKQKDRQTIHIDGQQVDITSLDKLLWPKLEITKKDYLRYLYDISDHLLPFLKNRLLTVVRYPEGARGESFYQKNCPDYAPHFIQTVREDDIDYIICSDLATLIWLGNQGCFEFHTPFQPVHSSCPSEIVLDLDPPSTEHFHLAIEAAVGIKEILDRLHIISYVKTTGNKGLQLYIPLPDDQFTYEQTRMFTHFIAAYMVKKEPKWFTTERMKADRRERLYIDYIQHAAGKTIITPYSVRGNEKALVATPLFWKEVNRSLSPQQFPMHVIKQRLKEKGCPFHDFKLSKERQPLANILDWLKENV